MISGSRHNLMNARLNNQSYDRQIKQRVHLPLNLISQYVIKEEFGKPSYTDSFSPKTNLPYNNYKILHESSVARFPSNKFAQTLADY